jgi:DNA-binding NarL/FixJ family response regulator
MVHIAAAQLTPDRKRRRTNSLTIDTYVQTASLGNLREKPEVGAGRLNERRNANGGETERPAAPLASRQGGLPVRAIATRSAGVAPDELQEILAKAGTAVRVRAALLSDAARADAVDMVIVGDHDAPTRLAGVVEHTQQMFPDAVVIVVVWWPNRTNVRALLAAGADAVVLAADLGRTLAHAAESASAGLVTVPRPMWHASAPATLSQRQRETLGMALAGLTNAEIARRLDVSEATVSTHLVVAFRRLAVHSRTEAATALLGGAMQGAPGQHPGRPRARQGRADLSAVRG